MRGLAWHAVDKHDFGVRLRSTTLRYGIVACTNHLAVTESLD